MCLGIMGGLSHIITCENFLEILNTQGFALRPLNYTSWILLLMTSVFRPPNTIENIMPLINYNFTLIQFLLLV